MTKLCIDCRFFRPAVQDVWAGSFWSMGRFVQEPRADGRFSKCARTDVVGGCGSEGNYCSIERQGHFSQSCGPEAKHFEPKRPPCKCECVHSGNSST